MVDLVAAARDIVLPAVDAVLREGEASGIELRERRGSVFLTLIVVAGETFSDEVVQAGVPGQTSDDWRERLRSNLADWVAESRFGWGQDRGV